MRTPIDAYEYRVTWSERDTAYIARVTEFPSLAAHGNTPGEALEEIRFVVAEVLKDLDEHGEAIPVAAPHRLVSGKISR